MERGDRRLPARLAEGDRGLSDLIVACDRLDLRASSLGRAMNLTWTAPGDDFHCGRADHYEIRASSTPITRTNWAQATVVGTMGAQAAGGLEAFSLSQRPGWAHYFAVRAID